MLQNYEVEQYRRDIREGRWEALKEAMDGKYRRCILALSAQIMGYEDVHQELRTLCGDLLQQVLDPRGGSLGWTYEGTEMSWQKLQSAMASWAEKRPEEKREEAGRSAEASFLLAMELCRIPMHLMEVTPEEIPVPFPMQSHLTWVEGDSPENMESSVHFYEPGAPVRGEHPAAGGFLSVKGMGYVEGYTTEENRPLTAEFYDAYPGQVMIRFESRPGDEFAYRAAWSAFIRWEERRDAWIRSEIDRILQEVSKEMQAMDERGGSRRRDEASYTGYGY